MGSSTKKCGSSSAGKNDPREVTIWKEEKMLLVCTTRSFMWGRPEYTYPADKSLEDPTAGGRVVVWQMLKSFGLDGCKSNVIICLIGSVCGLRHAKCKPQKVVDYSVRQIKIRWTVRDPLLQFSFAWKLRTIVINLCQSVWNQTSLQNRIETGLKISISSKLVYYLFNKIYPHSGVWS